MALDLIRESINVERVMAQGAAQALVEGSVLVPGNGREDIRLLFSDGDIILGNTEVQSDRVALEGTVIFHVLYSQGEEGNLHALEAATPFHHTLEVQGAGPRMQAQVRGALDSVEAEYAGGRITLRAVTSLCAQCSVASQVLCVTGLTGISGLQQLSRDITSLSTVGEGSDRIPITGEMELPDALQPVEPLYTRVTIAASPAEAGDGYATLRGEALAEVWLLSDLPERPLTRQRLVIPYSVDVPVPGCTPDLQVLSLISARDCRAELAFDQEGTPVLRVDLQLNTQVQAVNVLRVSILQDAYAASDVGIKLQSEKVSLRTRALPYSALDTMKTSLSLPAGAPPLGTILCVSARPASAQPSGSEGRTAFEGVIDMNVVYIPAGGSTPAVYREEVPYRVLFDASLTDDSWVNITAEECDAIPITADRLEFKCSLRLSGVQYETAEHTVALDADACESPLPPGGAVLVFTQAGETLWDIAKRYRVTADAITKFNPDIADPLGAGEKILLYNRRPAV